MKLHPLFTPLRGVIVVAAASMVLAACGGSSSSSADSAADASASAAPSTAASADSSDPQARLAELYNGTYTSAPTGGPKPIAGKKVWIISYLQAYSSSASTAQAASDAAEAMGWEATIFDAKGDPSQAVAGIQQAVAAKADAVLSIYFDCESVKAGLLTAKEAGVVTISDEAPDCKDKPLFDYVVSYNPGTYSFNDGSFETYVMGWQAVTADYIIAKSNGAAKTILVTQSDAPSAVLQAEGFRTQFSTCPGCSIVAEVPTVGTDLGAKVQQKVQQALLQHPEADSIAVPADAYLTGGVIGALKEAGFYGKIIIGGGEGSESVLPLVKDYPGFWGVSNLPTAWEGWQAMDAANRIMQGQKADPLSGIGFQITDKEHNMPADLKPTVTRDGAPIDFPAQYKAAWAASS